MPLSLLPVPSGLGVACTAHSLPFHLVTHPCAFIPLPEVPTAVHDAIAMHDTPFRLPVLDPAGSGTVDVDHDEPL